MLFSYERTLFFFVLFEAGDIDDICSHFILDSESLNWDDWLDSLPNLPKFVIKTRDTGEKKAHNFLCSQEDFGANKNIKTTAKYLLHSVKQGNCKREKWTMGKGS